MKTLISVWLNNIFSVHNWFFCIKGGRDCLMEVRRNGTVHRKVSVPDHLLSSPRGFSSFLLFNEVKITDSEGGRELVRFSACPSSWASALISAASEQLMHHMCEAVLMGLWLLWWAVMGPALIISKKSGSEKVARVFWVDARWFLIRLENYSNFIFNYCTILGRL